MNKPSPDPISPDARERMVADALSSLSHSFRPMSPADGELIQRRAADICKQVANLTRSLDEAVRAAGTKHDITTLVNVVSRKFAEGFSTWSKDELLYLIMLMHTDIVIDTMLGNTETPKIILPP